MAREDSIEDGAVEIGLFEHLLDAGAVFGAPDAGGDGDEVFGPENPARHAVELDRERLAHGFLGQSVGGEPLDGEAADHDVFAVDSVAEFLEMRVDGRDAGGETGISRDEEHVGIVGGERLGVAHRRQRAAERVVHDEASRAQAVCRCENVCEWDAGRGHGGQRVAGGGGTQAPLCQRRHEPTAGRP